MNTTKDMINCAAWIVCPMCDKKVCVGRFNCNEIKNFINQVVDTKSKDEEEKKYDCIASI